MSHDVFGVEEVIKRGLNCFFGGKMVMSLIEILDASNFIVKACFIN